MTELGDGCFADPPHSTVSRVVGKGQEKGNGTKVPLYSGTKGKKTGLFLR
jgi:hypothetical protein